MSRTYEKKIKLIATDLDGTLLGNDGKIPARNVSALREAIASGVYVTISTGRMFASTRRFAAEIGIDIPLICYNGAMMRHPDGTTLSHQPLDMDAALQLLTIFRERRIYVQSYIDDALYIEDAQDEHFQNYLKHFRIDGDAVGEALYRPQTPPTKLLAMMDDAESSRALADELRRDFGDRVYITGSNIDFVEMMNPNVNKGRSLEMLAQTLGIGMDEVMALGDGENDLEMLARAGLGVAPANARDRVKKVAADVGPANSESFVAWATEKYALA